MTDRQLAFLEGCCGLADGVAVGEGAFAPGPALWVGQREVAHFDSERTLDVRLTKSVIRQRREELKDEDRVCLRSGTSDWLEITIDSDDDLSWATGVVLAAVAANLSTARLLSRIDCLRNSSSSTETEPRPSIVGSRS